MKMNEELNRQIEVKMHFVPEEQLEKLYDENSREFKKIIEEHRKLVSVLQQQHNAEI